MITLAAAFDWLERNTHPLKGEDVPVAACCGRILAESIPPLPGSSPVAAIDGYAVNAAGTEGASDYAPLPVAAVPVVAGAPVPAGTDAVLPMHLFERGHALAAIPPGYGIAPADGLALTAGTQLRPLHLAILARRGLEQVGVVRRPGVALHVAGPKHGADALTPMLGALVAAAGGTIVGSAPDLVIRAGRSGLGPDDQGIEAFESVFAHGVLIRPGETSALGVIGGVPALLLPGDPVACATVFSLLAARALRRLGGRPRPEPVQAMLTRKIASGLGEIDTVLVALTEGGASPIGPAAATILSRAADANGLVLVPEGSEGYAAGATVSVHPLP